MRWLLWLLMVMVAGLSILFSALNATLVRLDLYFFQWHWPLGVVVLLSILLGCLLGGAALLFSVIVPLRMQLRRLKSGANSVDRKPNE